MLALTENAQAVIKTLVERPEVPEGTGVRIAPGDGEELQLSLQPEPADGDEVISAGGARIFLEPDTAQMLSNQTLDATVEDNTAGFYLTPSS